MKKISFLLVLILFLAGVMLASCGENKTPKETADVSTLPTITDGTSQTPGIETPTTENGDQTTEGDVETREPATGSQDPDQDPIEVFDEGSPSEGDGIDWVGPY